MPDSGINVRLQILVNGKVRGTAGMESIGVLSVILDWVRRDPKAASKPSSISRKEWEGNRVHVSLGGLDSVAEKHVEWFGADLDVGDEVTVRVLPPGEFDSPARREDRKEAEGHRSKAAARRRSKRETGKASKKKRRSE
jgi:hypothetical protein